METSEPNFYYLLKDGERNTIGYYTSHESFIKNLSPFIYEVSTRAVVETISAFYTIERMPVFDPNKANGKHYAIIDP